MIIDRHDEPPTPCPDRAGRHKRRLPEVEEGASEVCSGRQLVWEPGRAARFGGRRTA